MRNGTPGFQADRLIEARDARGLTQVALAVLINRKSSSISRWENSSQLPEPDALEALSQQLNIPVSFFLRPTLSGDGTPWFFRSMASTTQAIRRLTEVRMKWAQDISVSLQEWLDLPEINVPKLDVNDHKQIRDEDIEQIANECRKTWSIGTGPIADVLLVLENAGIVVIKEDIGTVKMDGLSNWSEKDGRPYILIAKDKDTCCRSRMDAAHELGHLVLHHKLNPKTLKNSSDFKEIERQAFYFAGAFLMPEESFASEIWSPSINSFISLKERWKTSVGAITMRCANLGIINEEQQTRIWKHYSSKGWRKYEPLDNTLAPENPRLLSRSIRLLIDENVRTREELITDFRLYGHDVESLCGLPHGYMTTRVDNVFNLPKLKPKNEKQVLKGSVVNFN